MRKSATYAVATALLVALSGVAAVHAQSNASYQQPSVQYYTPPNVERQIEQRRAEQEAYARQQQEAEQQAYPQQYESQAERMRQAEARSKWDWDHRGQMNRAQYGARRSPTGQVAAPTPCQAPGILARIRARYNPANHDYGQLWTYLASGVFFGTLDSWVMWIGVAAVLMMSVFWILWLAERNKIYDLEEGMGEIAEFFVGQNGYLARHANEAVKRHNTLEEQVDLAERLRKRAALAKPTSALMGPATNASIKSGDLRDRQTESAASFDPVDEGGQYPSQKEGGATGEVNGPAEERAAQKRLESKNRQIRFLKDQLRKYGEDTGNTETE